MDSWGWFKRPCGFVPISMPVRALISGLAVAAAMCLTQRAPTESAALEHFGMEPDAAFLGAVAEFRALRALATKYERPRADDGKASSWRPSSACFPTPARGEAPLPMREFLERAEAWAIPSAPPLSELPADLALACDFVANPGQLGVEDIVAWGAARLSRFHAAVSSLARWDALLRARRPPHLHAMDTIGGQSEKPTPIRPGVIAALCDAMDWPAVGSPGSWFSGSPLPGISPTAGSSVPAVPSPRRSSATS